jgi:hypothetical protein
MFNIGSGVWDATCQVFGLPHMIVGALPATSERIFSSGNERTMVFLNSPVSFYRCVLSLRTDDAAHRHQTLANLDILSILQTDSESSLI